MMNIKEKHYAFIIPLACFIIMIFTSQYLVTNINSYQKDNTVGKTVTVRNGRSSVEFRNIQKEEGYLTKRHENSEGRKINFKITEESLCLKRNETEVFLLVGVFVGIGDKVERQYIRTAWGNIAKRNPKLRLIFILGTTENSKLQSIINEESSMFHDIIQADFKDTYRNLTFKSLVLCQWTSLYCASAKYVLKMDADMRIDLRRLLQKLETRSVPDKIMCGYVLNHASVLRGEGKWGVPVKMYPQLHYPQYCTGSSFIMPKRIVDKIAALPVPSEVFPVDDAYITGILREQIHEEIAPGVISFYHHHDKTDVRLSNGRYIMTVTVT